MLDYTGTKCPVCGVPFQKDDDIVVCPECGAPYHRDCYNQVGKCVFEEELHKEGKEWTPPPPPEASKPPIAPNPSEVKDRECPVCGTLNGRSASFCTRCGASLRENHASTYGGQAGGAGAPPPYTPFGGMPFTYDPMGGVSPTEPLAPDVTFGDASKLVRQNTNYYMPVFRFIKQTGRNKFSFSAFLFSGAWMLYRKQYKWGAVVTGLMFALYAAFLCVYVTVFSPTMLSLATQAGVDLEDFSTISSEQYMAVMELAMEQPFAYFKLMTPFLCLVAIFVVMLVVGIRGNKMYMKHCIEVIRSDRAEQAEGNASTLNTRGGVNSMVPVLIAISFFLLRMLLTLALLG